MPFQRDVYYEALLERLAANVPGVVTWMRRPTLASKLSATQQPAGILLVATQTPYVERGVPTVWTLGADLFLLVRSTGQQDAMDTAANDLVDAVEAALLLQPGERSNGDPIHTTLGGLVQNAMITGAIDFRQSETGEQAEVVIPIDMVVMGPVPGQ